MTAEYRLMQFGVYRVSDSANIIQPTNPESDPDWLVYLDWLSQGNVPDPEVSFETLQTIKLQDLDNMCESLLLSGFESSALGTPHLYDSEITDQINLLGAIALESDTVYKCLEVGTNEKQWKLHTAQQLRQVATDASNFRLQTLQYYTQVRHSALTATTISELDNIVWQLQ